LFALPPNKRLKLTGHRAFQFSVLPFGHEIGGSSDPVIGPAA
jgi:hypothetical protein